MKRSILLILAHAVTIQIFLAGCSLDPDRKLNSAVERYLGKKPSAMRNLETEFIKHVSTDSISGERLQTNGRFLYTSDANDTEIVYPIKLDLSMPGGEGIQLCDVSDDYAVISDGIRISIFDGDGDFIGDETPGDKKSPVRSVLLMDGKILYYRNSTLYRYNIADKTSEQYLKETFPPPYAQHYTVSMYARGDFLCICAGIAGSYYLSIVNLPDERIILKNLSISSSKHAVTDNFVFYIKGSSGRWELIRYSLTVKSKQTLASFASIIDIELADSGYILENNSGLWASEYGGEKKRLPFAYQLAGTCRGMVLARHKESYYLIDTKRLFDVIRKLEEKAPELFKLSEK